jgi:hypothetical protein
MASLVATPTTSFLHPIIQPQPRQGILLNRNDVTPLSTPRRSPIDLPTPLPRNNSSYSSNSNSSDSSTSNSPPRKIRFAPLPDPRRATLLLEPAAAHTTDTQDATTTAAALSSGELIALTPVTSISGDSTVTGDDSEPRSETSSDVRLNTKKKKSKKWGKRLFGPLLKGGAKPDGPVPLCDSSQSSAHELGFPLGRRKSTGSTEPSARPRPSFAGSPLTLTRSAEGDGGATAPVRQQRMLNGRVYGARQTLPTTTTREPVFVEWGFGGTGAVTSGGSQYARLQSSNKLSLGTEATTADEDDGSGMAWVAKRRAAREEKARKEKEAALEEAERAKQVCLFPLYSRCPIQILCDLQAAKEEEEQLTAKSTAEASSQQFEDGETRPQTPTPAPNKSPSIPPLSRQSTEGRASDATSPPPPSLTSDLEEHHNTVKTISIPGAHPRPHHARNQSIASSKERTASSPPSSERESEHGSTTEDDDEDSETELDEDSEEVCPCLH